MQSSFAALALAFGIVTMTALPAMAFTLSEDPGGGEKLGAVPPNEPATSTSNRSENPPRKTAANPANTARPAQIR